MRGSITNERIKSIMYSDKVDYGEESGGSSMFYIEEEVWFSGMKAMEKEEVSTEAAPLTAPTNTNNSPEVMQREVRARTSLELPSKHRRMQAKKGSPKLIVGKDINFEQIPEFFTQALVGGFSVNTNSRTSLQHWITVNWSSLLGYEPIFYMLP